MGIIRMLDEHVANLIAAGEVVERPASVVKELVENAIDAGADTIEIEIEEGGLAHIRVKDNGRGIEPDDVPLAFQRHATSKVAESRDLFHIRTLGFRGEALPSIASVSRVEIVTSADKSGLGTRCKIEGGRILALEPTRTTRGTDFHVRDLFYNTPARLKYLKTVQTEFGHISDYINRIALAHPNIAIVLHHNGRQVLRTPGGGDLKQTIAAIYGTATARAMIPVHAESADFTLGGFAGKPELTRANRHGMTTIVNGRYVRSFPLQQAIMEAYHTLLPVNRYPLVVLQLWMDPSLVDVNVHPAKLEVRFSKERELMQFIEAELRRFLQSADLIPRLSAPRPKQAVVYEQLKLDAPSSYESALSYGASLGAAHSAASTDPADGSSPGPSAPLASSQEARAGKEAAQPSGGGTGLANGCGIQPDDGQTHAGSQEANAAEERLARPNSDRRDKKADGQAGSGPSDMGIGDVASQTGSGRPADKRNGRTSEPGWSLPSAPRNAGPQEQGSYRPAEEGSGRSPGRDWATDSGNGRTPAPGIGGTSVRRYDTAQNPRSGPNPPASRAAGAAADWQPYLQISGNGPENGGQQTAPRMPELRVIGQMHGTYIIAENETGLYLIDQHAAHERINYEYYYRKFGQPEQASQELLVPITLEFTPAEAEMLRERSALFEKIGVMFEPFGGNTFIVRALPEWMPRGSESELLKEIVDWVLSERALDVAKLREKTAIMTACKASLKANDHLSASEIESLLRRLAQCSNPFTCPHGRPIIVSFSVYELEKMFKRVM